MARVNRMALRLHPRVRRAAAGIRLRRVRNPLDRMGQRRRAEPRLPGPLRRLATQRAGLTKAGLASGSRAGAARPWLARFGGLPARRCRARARRLHRRRRNLRHDLRLINMRLRGRIRCRRWMSRRRFIRIWGRAARRGMSRKPVRPWRSRITTRAIRRSRWRCRSKTRRTVSSS